MNENFRIKFNPVTREIEVAGTEAFVKEYFSKLQAMLIGSKTLKEKAPKQGGKARSAKPAAIKQAKKTAKQKPAAKKSTNAAKVLSLIQASAEGVSTAELKKKTGLEERRIWAIVDAAAREGKIRKLKRGLYGSVSEEAPLT